MSELSLQVIAFLKLIWLSVYAFLYGLGGMSNKWIRRFIGSAWITIGICVFAMWKGEFNYILLCVFPLLIGALSLGYGAIEPLDKVRKRAICGLAIAFSFIPISINNQNWLLIAMNFPVCVLVSVLLGVFNPFKDARSEESTIAILTSILPIMSV